MLPNNTFSESFVEAFSWTLLHSIWQGLLLMFLLAIALKFTKKENTGLRYYLCISSIFSLFFVSIGTFLFYYDSSAEVVRYVISPATELFAFPFSESAPSRNIWTFFGAHQLLICRLWLIGSLILLIKLLGGFAYLRFITNNSTAHPVLNQSLLYVQSKIEVLKKVTISTSEYINTPMVIGLIKPLILFPASVINQLELDEIESIIAHELGHIHRQDFLINIFISIIEALYYFHPGVWWISKTIKNERELCCDQYALELNPDRHAYAKILIKLEEHKLYKRRSPNLAMTFSKNKFKLKNRIFRIMNLPQTTMNTKEKILTTLLVFSIVIAFASNKTNFLKDLNPIEKIGFKSISPNMLKVSAPPVIIDIPTPPPTPPTPPSFKSIKTPINLYEQDTIPTSRQTIKNNNTTIKIENGKVLEYMVNDEDLTKDHTNEELLEMIEKEDKVKYRRNQRGYKFKKNIKDYLKNWEGDVKKWGDKISWSDDDDAYVWKDGKKRKLSEQEKRELEADMKELGEYIGESLVNAFESFDGFEGLAKLKSLIKLENLEDDFNFENLKFSFPHLGKVLDDFHLDFEYDFNDHDLYDHDLYDQAYTRNKVSDKVYRAMKRDQIIQTDQENKIELSGKYLKINGEKQATNIWKKYKNLYEDATGTVLSRDSRIDLIFEKPSDRLSRRKI